MVSMVGQCIPGVNNNVLLIGDGESASNRHLYSPMVARNKAKSCLFGAHVSVRVIRVFLASLLADAGGQIF